MVTQQRRHVTDRAKSAVNEALTAATHPTEMVKEYPLSSMLVVFGVGMGVGVLVSQALIPSFHEPTMTERMGRQLYDSMCNLSNAVTRAMHA